VILADVEENVIFIDSDTKRSAYCRQGRTDSGELDLAGIRRPNSRKPEFLLRLGQGQHHRLGPEKKIVSAEDTATRLLHGLRTKQDKLIRTAGGLLTEVPAQPGARTE